MENTIITKIAALAASNNIEKTAISQNRIMSAINSRLAKVVANRPLVKGVPTVKNPAYEGYMAKKTKQQLYRMSNQLKGRLGTKEQGEISAKLFNLPSSNPYQIRMLNGVSSALSAGKPDVAGKILATQASRSSGGRAAIVNAQNRFMKLKPNEMGGVIDGARNAADGVRGGLAQTNSMFHTY